MDRIVGHIRRRWPRAKIVLGADSGFAREEMMAWCEGSRQPIHQPRLQPHAQELNKAGITISMDGPGRSMDNVFVERLWRSLKYEAVYLHERPTGFKADRIIGEWIDFYNAERSHSALAGQTPAEPYRAMRPLDMIDKPHGLPITPQAQQQQQDAINRF